MLLQAAAWQHISDKADAVGLYGKNGPAPSSSRPASQRQCSHLSACGGPSGLWSLAKTRLHTTGVDTVKVSHLRTNPRAALHRDVDAVPVPLRSCTAEPVYVTYWRLPRRNGNAG